ncbi:MAG: LamG-like jellyroll fold domain-containing protein [Pirellulales bacterium]
MNRNDERLEWIAEYVAGTASAETVAALEQAVGADEAFRDLFLEYLNIDLALSDSAAARDLVRPAGRAAPQHRHRILPWAIVGGLAVAAACVLVGVGNSGPAATVTRSVGPAGLAVGAAIRHEPIALAAGLLEVRTASGVDVVIEAPARFRFESAQRLRLERGRLSAEVPQSGHGFTVITPAGDAIDLGTRFGVDVPAQGRPEIHVFEGQVLAKNRTNMVQSLATGEATVFAAGGNETRQLRSSAFIKRDEVPALAAAISAGRQAASARFLDGLRTDPALIAVLDFDQDGVPEGDYRMVQGRWPGSRAAEFVNVGEHMKVDVGGGRGWPQLTLAAWVRLDRIGAPYHSLYYTDGFQKEPPGFVHWMLTGASLQRIAFIGNRQGVYAANDSRRNHWTTDSVTPVLSERGRWVHLAMVYDSDKGSAKHYLDGRLDADTLMEVAHPARLGPARIGNWDKQDRKLSGRIDELVILGRCLSDAEVQALFVAGNPYQGAAEDLP